LREGGSSVLDENLWERLVLLDSRQDVSPVTQPTASNQVTVPTHTVTMNLLQLYGTVPHVHNMQIFSDERQTEDSRQKQDRNRLSGRYAANKISLYNQPLA